jgi:hypothetical protein
MIQLWGLRLEAEGREGVREGTSSLHLFFPHQLFTLSLHPSPSTLPSLPSRYLRSFTPLHANFVSLSQQIFIYQEQHLLIILIETIIWQCIEWMNWSYCSNRGTLAKKTTQAETTYSLKSPVAGSNWVSLTTQHRFLDIFSLISVSMQLGVSNMRVNNRRIFLHLEPREKTVHWEKWMAHTIQRVTRFLLVALMCHFPGLNSYGWHAHKGKYASLFGQSLTHFCGCSAIPLDRAKENDSAK